MEKIPLQMFIFISLWFTASAFSCDSNSKCGCEQLASGYELRCPGNLNIGYTADYGTQFECDYNSAANFSAAYGSDFGNSPTVTFMNCYLPENTFIEIFNLSGIRNVLALSFKSNKKLLNSLKANHFDGLNNLTLLNLENNYLTNIPFNIFHDMTQLQKLNLRQNALHLQHEMFSTTKALIHLELGSNNLSALPSGIFENLGNLSLLNLEQNAFTTLDRDWFEGLKSLEVLDLHSNRLEMLPGDVFQFIPKLKQIILSLNQFTSLPKGLFSHNENLEEVIFFGNQNNMGNLSGGIFSNLTNLSNLVLNENKIMSLSSDFLQGAISLKTLSLKGNSLHELPEGLFEFTKELTVLDLSQNNIANLLPNVFKSLDKLQDLNLQFNNLKTVNENVLQNLPSLQSLNLKGNGMIYIPYYSLEGTFKLKFVDASDNFLNFSRGVVDYSGTQSIFAKCEKIEELKLQNNSVKELFADFPYLHNLKKVDLQHNKINYLQTADFSNYLNSADIDLQYNNISTIDIRLLRLNYEATKDDFKVTINIQNNPLNCDCKIWMFYTLIRDQWGQDSVSKNFKFITNDLKCAQPSNLANQTLKNVNPRDIICKMDKCPSQCDCWRRDFDSTTIIDCSYGNYTSFPDYLPKYQPRSYISLNMSHNRLLHLSNNQTMNYSSITSLDLSYNHLDIILKSQMPPNVTNLYMNNNNFTKMSSEILKYFEGMKNKSLALYDNPFHCTCDIVDFLQFVRKNLASLILSNNITCYDTKLQIQKLTADDVCTTYTTVIIAVSITLTLLAIGAAVVAGLYYRNQHTVKVWMYSHKLCLWFVTETELDKDKVFDAFISYSHKDEDFVTGELVSKLETEEPKYKLCLHYRDWIAGEWIPNQVVRSVDDSRRTIVVLSKNFLESVWGRLEFKAAHLQALQDKTRRVIIIVYGEIPDPKELDEELRAYISMNTYLKWDDPWFWQKLRYAMPHKCRMFKKSKSNDDRLELIRTEILSNHSPLHSTS